MFQIDPSDTNPSRSTNSTSSKPSCVARRQWYTSPRVATCFTWGRSRSCTVVRTRTGEVAATAGGPTRTRTPVSTGRPASTPSSSRENTLTCTDRSPGRPSVAWRR
jgi:hypothetical protein